MTREARCLYRESSAGSRVLTGEGLLSALTRTTETKLDLCRPESSVGETGEDRQVHMMGVVSCVVRTSRVGRI